LRPSLSPDGTRLAIASSDVWVYEWQRDTMTRLTFGARAIGPIWSPDGRYILFQAPGGMFWTRSDGSGKSQSLTESNNGQVPWSITADGKRLAFHEVNQNSLRIWTVALENDGTGLRAGKPELFSQTRFDEAFPSFSPDGRWLAYTSDESGTYQVYVRAFPGKEGKWQVSNNGGELPEWAHSGHELFFRTLDNQIMVAGYTAQGDSFVADKPRVWSEKRIANVGDLPNYGLAPDGKRIVALMPVEESQAQQAQNHVIFLENFFDELRRKVPLSGK
jgi:eukaryotic-like serine/threonine-protein kinase